MRSDVRVELVDFISVPTRDATRALAWYTQVLGLPLSEYTAAEVETPNVTLSFWLPDEQGEQFVPNQNGIALRVADVEAAVDEVRAAGGEVIGIEDRASATWASCKDPDGNVVILH